MKHYEVVCGLIYNSNNEFLVCKRGPGRALEGYWEFPGGKIKTSETKEMALKRELIEELDLNIDIIRSVDKSYYEYLNEIGYDPFSITMYGFLAKIVGNHIILKEHTAFKWVKKEDLKDLIFAPADITFVEYIKSLN